MEPRRRPSSLSDEEWQAELRFWGLPMSEQDGSHAPASSGTPAGETAAATTASNTPAPLPVIPYFAVLQPANARGQLNASR